MTTQPPRSYTRFAIAIVIAAVVISASILAYSSFERTVTGSRTTSESSPGITSMTITTDSTTLPPISWSYQGLASAVTNSSEVKPHITNAYYYFIMRDGAASPG